jgi:hypothetical protein
MSTITDVEDLREQDVIDSRDIAELARFLRVEAENRELTDEEESILDLDDDRGGGIPDWIYGETLIAESYFVEYAQELAHGIGAVNDDHGWPLMHINWDAAAEALKADYVELEILGSTYLARA